MTAILERGPRPERPGPRTGPVAPKGARALTLAFALALLLPACASIPGMGRDQHSSRSPQETLGWKVVIEKRDPNLLLAVDGTECVVSEERFERIRTGRRAFCHWRTEGMGN
jgi:hypothetical protein